MSSALERRYRRVLRLLPAYYRRQWEEDMVAAFLDSWLTGDQEADGANRIVTLSGYLHVPHLMALSLTELLISVAAVALVARDAQYSLRSLTMVSD